VTRCVNRVIPPTSAINELAIIITTDWKYNMEIWRANGHWFRGEVKFKLDILLVA